MEGREGGSITGANSSALLELELELKLELELELELEVGLLSSLPAPLLSVIVSIFCDRK